MCESEGQRQRVGERYVETVVDWVCEKNSVGQIHEIEDKDEEFFLISYNQSIK